MIKFKRLTIALAALFIASATAWADETLLLTIESKDNTSFYNDSKTFDDKVTVTFSNSVTNNGDTDGWYSSGAPSLLTVAGTNDYTITSCKFYTKYGTAANGYTVEGESPSVYLSGYEVYTDDSKSVSIGEYGITKIEVYTAAASSSTPVDLAWNAATKTGTFKMPAANVTLNVEYEPELTATFKALTANTIQAGKATVTLTDNTQGATPQSATLDADGKLTPVYEGQTITLTAQTGYKFRSVTATKGEGAASVTTATPLTMECLSDGTIKVGISGTLSSGMQYAVNGGTKATITTTTTIEGLTTGDKVQFYGVGTSTTAYGYDPEVEISGGTATVKVYGNIMSLLDEENFATKTDLPNSDYVFYGLFYGNGKLTDASGLLLPATTLAKGCYQSMFSGCTALTAAPALPATTLAEGCYYNMFYGCTKLASVTCKATDISATYCLYNWLNGAGTDATSPTLYVEPTMTENMGWNNANFTVTAIPGN